MSIDVLPHAVRGAALRSAPLDWLGVENRDDIENRRAFESLAALMVAIVDGLALQAALEPERIDAARSFRVLEFPLCHSFDGLTAWLQDGGLETDGG
jgi:hypothetical protein